MKVDRNVNQKLGYMKQVIPGNDLVHCWKGPSFNTTHGKNITCLSVWASYNTNYSSIFTQNRRLQCHFAKIQTQSSGLRREIELWVSELKRNEKCVKTYDDYFNIVLPNKN